MQTAVVATFWRTILEPTIAQATLTPLVNTMLARDH
jgi:hypothetical protein